MSPGPQIPVPDNCTAVSLECPVEGTVYGYYPSLGANAFFAAFFGLCALLQLAFGIKYKTWTYMIALVLGCAGECAGYVGRVLLHNNPYDETGFQIQIVLLIFCPAFLAAGIYLTLKHVVLSFGEEWSRLRPSWYTYIFIACDISSLVLQSVGGGVAATADDSDRKALDAGTDIMIAGIIWQVIVLVVFAAFATEYAIRTYRRRDQLSASASSLLSSMRFRLFAASVIVAYIGILIRCVYRIPELVEGWGSDMMRQEGEFIALEGVMIVITVAAQTIFHPGYCFPALASTFGKKGQKSISESDVEMMEPRS
ncbi:RTA1-domain-containing protein [Trematosphaeria pertusa]|uniref:RTA1-domain-containing protein n=1 Tax=Trematosphaeria pertusa TaxID=390896 RepID=A0A6A6HZ26_9PLEO|nr:RTA1-domain-containing protein [Trematosphaeria pertusa]KAF2242873.1 RTA1-domain-containing protein [Trematosphaeria pertusa]